MYDRSIVYKKGIVGIVNQNWLTFLKSSLLSLHTHSVGSTEISKTTKWSGLLLFVSSFLLRVNFRQEVSDVMHVRPQRYPSIASTHPSNTEDLFWRSCTFLERRETAVPLVSSFLWNIRLFYYVYDLMRHKKLIILILLQYVVVVVLFLFLFFCFLFVFLFICLFILFPALDN